MTDPASMAPFDPGLVRALHPGAVRHGALSHEAATHEAFQPSTLAALLQPWIASRRAKRKDQPPVKVCNILTPGGFDHFMVKLGELGAASEDPAIFAATAAGFGITMVGPTLADKLGLDQPA